MKKRKTLIWMLSLVCLLVVGIGFAAMQKTLSVTGTVTLTPDESAFNVEFTSVSGGNDGDTIKIKDDDTHQAEFTVSSLKAAGDTATFTLVITNTSTKNMAATISALTVKNEVDAANAFTVTTSGGSKTIQKAGTETITVTVTLDITPVENVSGSFTVEFTADPALAAQA